jgi:hypothetical protein
MKNSNSKIYSSGKAFDELCPIKTNKQAIISLQHLITFVWIKSDLDTKEATQCVEQLDDVVYSLEKLSGKFKNTSRKGTNCPTTNKKIKAIISRH